MGHMEHDPTCQDPLSEHNGNEWCITWVEDAPPDPVVHYKRGPQGGQIPDHRADYLSRYGEDRNPTRPLGTITEDRRDNRDPEQVYREHMAESNGL